MTEGPPNDLPGALRQTRLLESLAAVEHERWSHWQRYLHSKCEAGEDGALTIPAAFVEHWSKQMSTPYDELSEKEKDSDREQVQRYLPIIADALNEIAK